VHTPNVSFEGNNASEWATTLTQNLGGLGPFTSFGKSYSRIEGLEVVTFGHTSETQFPIQSTSRSVNIPPQRDARYTLDVGQSLTHTYSVTTTINTAGQPQQTVNATNTYTVRYLGRETVTVPAGTFEACKFELDNGILTSWEAVGKGITVKSLAVDTGGGTTTLTLTSGTRNGEAIRP
jgi:hypothetical protein